MSALIPGAQRIYSQAFAQRGLKGIVKWDVVPVANGEPLRLTFEATNASTRRGVWLKCDRGIAIDGKVHASVDLWSDTAEIVTFVCRTGAGKLSVDNIWDDGGRKSQGYTFGMRVAEIASGLRYSCNDVGFETVFDRLVFRIERTQLRATKNGAAWKRRRVARSEMRIPRVGRR
jgi:hypothetical protein